MRFAYERYDIPKSPLDGSTKIYRPEIPIHLLGKTGELFSYGLVDTGADSVVISTTIAEHIGAQCDTTRRWPVHGFAGQTVEAMLGHLELEIVGPRESYCWRLPVAVVEYPDDSQEEIIALGQLGFLEHFDVRFFGDAHVLELKPNTRFPKQRRRSTK